MAVATTSESPESGLPDTPPKVPPRTKRKPKPAPQPSPEVQPIITQTNPEREVLVATSRGTRERKAESRQREPPAMLVREASVLGSEEPNDPPVVVPRERPRKGPHLLVLPPHKGPRLYSPVHQPIRLLPAQPVTYGNWMRRTGPGDPEINSSILRRLLTNHVVLRPVKVPPGKNNGYPFKVTTSASTTSCSKSVTRSGSLSSQGSTGSDSGNESRPKSALKKVRRGSCEPKKCVTFNALTTVQVMEE